MGKKIYEEKGTYTTIFGDIIFIKKIEKVISGNGEERIATVSFPEYNNKEKVVPVKYLKRVRGPNSILSTLEKNGEITLPNGIKVIRESAKNGGEDKISLKLVSPGGSEVKRTIKLKSFGSLLWRIGKKFPLEPKEGDILDTLCGKVKIIGEGQGYDIKFLNTGNEYHNIKKSIVASGFVLDFLPPNKAFEGDKFKEEKKIIFKYEYDLLNKIEQKNEAVFKAILKSVNPEANDPGDLNFIEFKRFYSRVLLQCNLKNDNI